MSGIGRQKIFKLCILVVGTVIVSSAVAGGESLSGGSKALKKLYTRCTETARPVEFKNLKPLPSIVQLDSIEGSSISVAFSFAHMGRPVLFYAHGQGETLDDLERFFTYAEKNNFNMISWDYPCYGKTPGTPTEKSLTDSGLKVLRWLSIKAPKSPIILWGQSLGAAVVFQIFKANSMQERVTISRVVVLSPWQSFKTACSDKATFIFCSDDDIKGSEYKNLDVASAVNVPIIFVYSLGDQFVSFKRTKAVMSKIAAEFVRRIELGENVAHEKINNDDVLSKIADFIEGRFDSRFEAMPKGGPSFLGP